MDNRVFEFVETCKELMDYFDDSGESKEYPPLSEWSEKWDLDDITPEELRVWAEEFIMNLRLEYINGAWDYPSFLEFLKELAPHPFSAFTELTPYFFISKGMYKEAGVLVELRKIDYEYSQLLDHFGGDGKAWYEVSTPAEIVEYPPLRERPETTPNPPAEVAEADNIDKSLVMQSSTPDRWHSAPGGEPQRGAETPQISNEAEEKDDHTAPTQKSEESEKKGKAGRPKAGLSDFSKFVLADDVEGTLKTLHKLIDGGKGKDAGWTIRVCVDSGILKAPGYKDVQKEFGDIGVRQGYQNHFKQAFANGTDMSIPDEYRKMVLTAFGIS